MNAAIYREQSKIYFSKIKERVSSHLVFLAGMSYYKDRL